MLKKTKIVCTMGPSTEKQEIIENLLNSGMNFNNSGMCRTIL